MSLFTLPASSFLYSRPPGVSSVREEVVSTTEEDVEVSVPEVFVVERIIEVPEVRFVEKIVPVIRKEKRYRYVEKPVFGLPARPLQVERIVARPVMVPVEVLVERQVPVVTEEVVEVEHVIPKYRVKEVEREVPDFSQQPELVVERKIHYENIVEKKFPIIREVVRHVPKVQVVEVIKEVPEVEYEDEIVEIEPPRKFSSDFPSIEFIDKVVEIPIPRLVEKIVQVPVEQKTRKFVDKYVEKEVDQIVEKLVHVPPPPVVISLPPQKIRRPKLPPNSPFARP